MADMHPHFSVGRLARPDGATIHYETAGAGAGPALVFAHGLGGNHMSWWRSAPVFARTSRVVTLAHRGFAPSTTPGGTPDPRAYAGDLVALLDHLAIEKAVIVGQSMGGWTAVETTLLAPDRVAGLVMACTSGSFDYDRFGDPRVAAWRARTPGLIAAMQARGVHRGAGLRMAEEQPELHALYLAIERSAVGPDKDAVGLGIRAMRTRGGEDAARIGCPVLFITGAEDVLISPVGIALVAATFPDARVVEVPASGHSVYFERAGIFNALIDGFLKERGLAA